MQHGFRVQYRRSPSRLHDWSAGIALRRVEDWHLPSEASPPVRPQNHQREVQIPFLGLGLLYPIHDIICGKP
eukprot:g30078.t1